jgi:succinate dehydrogenase/fumarate reductase flavoprotein subunit
MASFDYDVVIIGSGLGGSVAALRAAEKGYSSAAGIHRKCGRSHCVFGMSSSFHRRPDSITPTRY